MKSIFRSILIALLACSLSTIAIATETAPSGDQKPVPPAAVAAPEKSPQAATTTPPVVNPQPSPQVAIPQPAGAPAATVTPQIMPEPIKAQSAIMVGIVDLLRLRAESDPGKAGQAKLAEKKKKLQTQAEAKRKQIDKFKETVEAQMPTLSPDQREAKSREFRKKVEEFQKFGQNAENDLQKLQQELSSSLFEKVEKAAAEYAKSNNLSMVIPKGDLLYQSGGVLPMDVTEGVMKLINDKKVEKKK